MLKIIQIIKKYKARRYWERRNLLWQQFKIHNQKLECSLIQETPYYKPRWWEYNCNNCSYNKDFFEKYGCMYIKDFDKLLKKGD